MSAPPAASSATVDGAPHRGPAPAFALSAALLGFFVITLDASVVNVALPDIRGDLGGDMSGLQWVMDGYTLMFAALLLSAGSLSDRAGARRAFGIGLAVFVASSTACGLAPDLVTLVIARMVQGLGAATMTPSSLALIREAYDDPVKRGRAIALWTIGGAVAAAAGPVAGGSLALVSWRMIFFINLPVGLVALLLLLRVAHSPRRDVPFDWIGQIAAVLAMGALAFGVIEAGAEGLGGPRVLVSLAITVLALVVFVAAQARGKQPMVPLDLFRSRTVLIASGTGFAFIGGFQGMVFVYSLYLQQQRGLSSFATGLAFVPMTVLSAFVSVLAARLAERYGPRVPIVGGMLLMGTGTTTLAFLPASTPAWALSFMMIPVGICGPLAMAPTTALLLESVPAHRAGVASGVFNTSRQLGGALAVAVFGALLAGRDGMLHGLRESLAITAVMAFVSAAANLFLRPARQP